jgi:hypothetical protein
MVAKEYRCIAHALSFTSSDKQPRCPRGCSTIVREFLTAPALRSERTKISDRALDRLAARYQLTDLSNRNGSVGASRKTPKGMEAFWQPLPTGNVYEVGKGEVPREGSAGGATAALAGMGMTDSGGAISELMKALPRPRPHAVGHEPGSAKDFDNALASAP